MKRLLWCLCLCSLCPLTIVGCGDDEGGDGATSDGGVVTPADLDDVNAQLEELDDSLTGLTGDVGDLGGSIDDLTSDLASLAGDAGARLDALENPDIPSCSADELCIPDGINLSEWGLDEIISLVCTHEVDCCDTDELNLKFGPGVETVDDCVDVFTDVVNSGSAPSFVGSSPYIVNQVILIAQVLNDPNLAVVLNPEGIEACIESLQDHECPEYIESTEEPVEGCVEPEEYDEDPCSLWSLLIGLQEAGEACGAYSSWYGWLPECAEGLYCSFDGVLVETNDPRGICAPLAAAGDGCQVDADCDPWYDEAYYGPDRTNLFCNQQNAECTALGGEGDPCALIDDTFTFGLSPFSGNSALSLDCMTGLTCDPLSETCVSYCSEGRLCHPYDQSYVCPDDFVCNVTEFPEFFNQFGGGVCTAAFDPGDTCTVGTECTSGSCGFFDDDNETTECADELIEAGDDCGADPVVEGAYDVTCETNWCDQNGNCAVLCNCEGDDCDTLTSEYGEPTPCPDDFYCDFGSSLGFPWYACEPTIANNTSCDSNPYHESCDSGFCNPAVVPDVGPYNVCRAKETAGTDAPCPSGYDEQCPNNQYCNSAFLCKPYLDAGDNCDLLAAIPLECDPSLVCVDETGNDTCQARAGLGDNCSTAVIPLADPSCEVDLTCTDIDGPGGAGVVFQCFDSNGTYENGVFCNNNNALCASGWCQPNSHTAPTSWNCAPKIEVGELCNPNDTTLNTCEDGFFCNYSFGEPADGRCAEQNLPGQSCKPFLGGRDCLNYVSGSNCVLVHDQFLCNQTAQPFESFFCDGPG